MVENKIFKDIVAGALVLILFILAAVLLYPILISIFLGVLLASIFYPLYELILKKVKNETLSASLVGIGLLFFILIVFALILSYLVPQTISLYLGLQKLDLTNLARSMVPNFFSSELSTIITSSVNTFLSNFLSGFLSKFSNFLLEIPIFLLQVFIVMIVFFFSLRDGKIAMNYLRSLLPIKKEDQEKFFKQFKDITYSVLIGQVIVGVIQGLIAGIGYFIFGVSNGLLLTILTIISSIIPMIGSWIVWVPVDIYLFATGNSGAGFGLLIYGIVVVSLVDNILRPLIVSRRTRISSAIIIIGMIGGLFVFGVLGLIIGPLILAYVLLVIEIYRKKTLDETDGIIFKKGE